MDDIVDRLISLFWQMKHEGKTQAKNVVADAISEIERLRTELVNLPEHADSPPETPNYVYPQ
jgi:predicted glycoside hydrolase/deacetylase ChbG (UPF0249 family)